MSEYGKLNMRPRGSNNRYIDTVLARPRTLEFIWRLVCGRRPSRGMSATGYKVLEASIGTSINYDLRGRGRIPAPTDDLP